MDVALERLQRVLKDEIANGDVRIFKGTLGLTIDIVNTFMFDTGSTEISPKGEVILGKIATLLNDLDGYFVGVIGNADSRPIVTPALKKKYPTNWELSSVRGAVVVRFILAHSNLSPGRIIAMGLGQYQPIDTNATAQGQGNNRRVDIVLLPVDVLASVVIGAEIK
jgi:chemotaxis protein MotB